MEKIFYIHSLLALNSCANLEKSNVEQNPCNMRTPENYAKCVKKKSRKNLEAPLKSSTPNTDELN